MKLIYRGNTYELNRDQARPGNTGRPARAAQPSRSPYTLMYRGVKLTIDPTVPSLQMAAYPVTYDLLYRGVTYHVTRDVQGIVTALTQPARKVVEKKVFVPSTLPLSAIARVHKANLLNNLQRRLQSAQERRDQNLILQLEAERQQITTAYNS